MLRFALGVILGLLVGAGGVAGWWYVTEESDDGDVAEEERLADAFAGSVSATLGDSSVQHVERVGADVWLVRLDRENERDACYLIQLDRFAPLAEGWFAGTSPTTCED